jgi:hypothetical protein
LTDEAPQDPWKRFALCQRRQRSGVDKSQRPASGSEGGNRRRRGPGAFAPGRLEDPMHADRHRCSVRVSKTLEHF